MTTSTNLKLSAAGKVLVSLSLAYIGSATAANIEAVGDTKVSQQGKVDIVNIAAPNEQGLSHNQYNKYNVAKEGAVLNNALQDGTSQLAGSLKANSNLNNAAAAVILNEVVSKNPSLILGKQEVFGMAADYVLANPNGITHKGGTVINAPRASFVVGQADIENGRIASFSTGANNSAAVLEVGATVDGSNNILDFIAPKVRVSANADLRAKQGVNVVSGANRVGYEDGSVEKVERAAGAPVLDGAVYGSIRAGSIRVHSTDERAKQQINGKLNAEEDLTVKVTGNLDVKAAQLASAKDMALEAQTTTVDGVLTSKDSNGQPKVTAATAPVRYVRDRRGRRVPVRNVQPQNFDAFAPTTVKGKDGVTTSSHTGGSSQSYEASSIQAGNILSLKNTGNVNLEAVKISAGSLRVEAENLNTSTKKTVNVTSKTENKSKGLWYNNTREDSRDEVVHATDIKVADNAVVNLRNKANLQSAQVNIGKDLTLVATNGIRMDGVKSTDNQTTHVDFKNETAALKTGSSDKQHALQSFHATQITAGGNVKLESAKTLDASGAKVRAGGDLQANVQRLNLDTASTVDNANVNDTLKYWGGIGGGKDGRANIVNETLHGASLTAGGKLIVDSEKGLKVRGSELKGGVEAAVNAGSGKAEVVDAVATSQNVSHERIGTIFNITKKRSDTESTVQTSNGSTLASDTNLKLVSKQDILVKGSQLNAAGDVVVHSTAGNVGIVAAATQSHYNNSSFSIAGKATGSVTPPKINLTEVPGIAVSNVKVKDGKLSGKVEPAPGFIDPSVSVSGGLGLVITNASDKTNVTKHSGSSVTGNNVIITAEAGQKAGGNVNVAGSKIEAKERVTLDADKDVNVTAVQDVVDSNASKRVTDIGITATATAGIGSTPKASVKFGIDSGFNNTHAVSSNASVSALSAKDVSVIAKGDIKHEGTKINATETVTERGQSVTHNAATNTVDSNTVEHKGGISLTVGASASKALSTKLAVHGSGGTGAEKKQTATVSEINAGKDVSVTATKGNVSDVGTKYNAGGTINVDADAYSNTAAVETSSHVSNKGGAELYVSAGTSDFATIDASVGGNVSFQHGHGNATKSVKGTLNGENVIVNANKGAATIAADVNAKNDVSIKADKGVTFTESKDTENTVSGGFNLGGSVGVKIIPEAGVVVPSSVSVNAGVNVGKKDYSKGTGSTIEAGNDITLEGNNKVELQGANVVAKNNVSIKGDQVTTTAASTKNNEVGVGVGGNLSLGLGDSEDPIKSFDVGVDVDVKHNKADLNEVNVIKGGNEVSIAGNFQGAGVKLTGTDVIGAKVDITNAKGTVEMNAVSSSYSNVDVGVGINVGGELEIDKWTEQEVRTWLDRCGYSHVSVTEKEHIRKIWNQHGGGRLKVNVGGGGGGGGGKIILTPPPEKKGPPSTEYVPPNPPVVDLPVAPIPEVEQVPPNPPMVDLPVANIPDDGTPSNTSNTGTTTPEKPKKGKE